MTKAQFPAHKIVLDGIPVPFSSGTEVHVVALVYGPRLNSFFTQR